MTPLAWVMELAAGLPAPAAFPRDLRAELAFGSPDTVVVDLPRLTLAAVQGHLAGIGLPVRVAGADRALRGCVFAWRGEALLFVAADDPEDERRYTLAHELAHVLRHYRQPRNRCVAVMGAGILGVLDGDRKATPEEAMAAALRGVPLGPHTHLFDRTATVSALEGEADRLACELLAPAAAVRGRPTGGSEVERELTEFFCLPAAIAQAYAREFVPAVSDGGRWLAALKNHLRNPSNS